MEVLVENLETYIQIRAPKLEYYWGHVSEVENSQICVRDCDFKLRSIFMKSRTKRLQTVLGFRSETEHWSAVDEGEFSMPVGWIWRSCWKVAFSLKYSPGRRADNGEFRRHVIEVGSPPRA